MSNFTIISDIPSATGWAPILHMQQMLAEVTGATIHDVSMTQSSRLQSYLYAIKPRAQVRNECAAIFIATTGYNARKFFPVAKALGNFSRVAIWILDSFWTEAAERERHLIRKHFDLVFYTQRFDSDFYQDLFGSRATLLEWGTDALDLGSHNASRSIDLLRVGRQPASWDNDAETERLSKAKRLRFAGRPAMNEASETILRTLMKDHYSQTKFMLAHSNVAAPASYTHPTKAYITGRWTDALACGAVVAGMPPEGDLHLLDWPEALLRLSNLDRDDGMERLAMAVQAWTPQVALRNHLGALRNLDWRWRFRKLVDALGVRAPKLDEEIIRLKSAIKMLSIR